MNLVRAPVHCVALFDRNAHRRHSTFLAHCLSPTSPNSVFAAKLRKHTHIERERKKRRHRFVAGTHLAYLFKLRENKFHTVNDFLYANLVSNTICTRLHHSDRRLFYAVVSLFAR